MNFPLFMFRLFIFWYIVGVFLLTFDLLPPALEWANAVFLILSGILGGIYFSLNYPKGKGLLLSIVIVVTTMFVEWIGVEYQLFFGHYDYNSDFGIKIGGVPIAIGFAWLMVISTTHVLAKQILRLLHLKSFIAKMVCYAIVGAFAAVVIDLIIDPVAFKVKEYWLWYEGGLYYDIPFSNFLGWFLLAFFLHVIVFLLLRNEWAEDCSKEWSKKMVLLFVLIIAMFTILAIQGQLFLAATVTVVLTIMLLFFYKKGETI